MATVGLCMIVRDEAPVIGRCLDSVAALIDHWTVVDTGSADMTPALVEGGMPERTGRLYHSAWVDFATNRSEALALARPHADYTLVMDADDVLRVPEGWTWPELTADSYALDIVDVGTTYRRPALVRNALAWRYRGVLHEFLDCEGAGPAVHLPGPAILRGHDGARRRDPDTYRRDAAVLERALADEADPMLRTRYAFYLAQSLRDAGEIERAIGAYLRRAAMGGWAEEVYVSLLWAGRLAERAGRPLIEASGYFRSAFEACPHRAEALHDGARVARLAGDHAIAFGLAEAAAALPLPADGLFVEPAVYGYAALDELAVAAWWTGRYRQSLDAGLRALQGGVPEAERPRVLGNMRHALERLPA